MDLNELKLNWMKNWYQKEHLYFSITLQSFGILGVVSADKMYVEIWKIYRCLYDWEYTP